MPGMVTPATIGWNIVSSSCRPEEVPRRLRRVRRLVEVGEAEQRRAHQRREDRDARPSRSGSTANSIDEQVRPGVHLVLRLGAGLLDRPRLDDREQPLRVTAGAGGGGRGERGRGGGGRGAGAAAAGDVAAAAGRAALRALGPLEQVRGDLGAALGARRPRPACRRGGGRSLGRAAASAARRVGGRRLGGGRSASPPSSPGTGRPSALRRSVAALQQVFGDRRPSSAPLAYSGPEMPPSFRTRQKWTAMKMTMTNGNSSTWSTYHRSSVSLLISFEPEQHVLHRRYRRPGCSPSCSCRR